MNNVLKPHGRNFMKAIHSLMIRQVREKSTQVISEGKMLELAGSLKRPAGSLSLIICKSFWVRRPSVLLSHMEASLWH